MDVSARMYDQVVSMAPIGVVDKKWSRRRSLKTTMAEKAGSSTQDE